MRLEQAVHRGFRDEVLPLVGEAHGQLARRQLRLIQGQLDDLAANLVGDAVPDPLGLGLAILQSLWAAGLVEIVPALEGGSREAEHLQRSTNGQMGLLD